MSRVTVYTLPDCMACTLTCRHLYRLGVPYTTELITGEVRDALAAQGFQAAPVVIVIHDDGTITRWAGYRPDRITALRPAPLDLGDLQ